jgi:hypothetical protein
MRDFIKRALTRRIPVKGHRKQIELEPSTKLVYGMYFAVAALISLTILEAMYIIVLRSFSSEIFSAITGLIGTIVGVFVTSKG